MQFLVSPRDDHGWVATTESITAESLKGRILGADVCLSDLDDTDAPSPAKIIVRAHAMSLRGLDPRFFWWGFMSCCAWALSGKRAESERWRAYVDTFLRSSKDVVAIRHLLSRLQIEDLFYPGVLSLYRLLPAEIRKIYVTRNIPEIGNAFARVAGVDEVLSEVFDKEKATAELVERHGRFRRYFVKGDSLEDEAMLSVLSFYQRRGKIDEVTSCYRADSPERVNERFTISVGKNYLGLVGLLT